jgi:hypothetical protein
LKRTVCRSHHLQVPALPWSSCSKQITQQSFSTLQSCIPAAAAPSAEQGGLTCICCRYRCCLPATVLHKLSGLDKPASCCSYNSCPPAAAGEQPIPTR